MDTVTIALIAGLVLLFSAISGRFLYKFGVPTLFVFLAVGMLMGSDGPGGIFYHDYISAREIADFGLIFLLFFGGLNTNWHHVKHIALRGGVLATVGVFLTGLLIGFFVHLVLGFGILEGLLLGFILAPTDAASVFNILRFNRVNMKNDLAPFLEVESGSNDLLAHVMVLALVKFLSDYHGNIVTFIGLEIVLGIFIGVVMGKLSIWIINRMKSTIDGLYSIAAIGLLLTTFALAGIIHGSGFIAVYILGMFFANSRLSHKVTIVRYFDGVSWLAQIMIFFLLGLLVYPTQLLNIAPRAIFIALFLVFIARPIVVFSILTLFKRPFKEQVLVSWTGFRGAAPIVFATYPFVYHLNIAQDVFNIVFFVTVITVLLQGTTFMYLAKKLGFMVRDDHAGLIDFSDFMEEIEHSVLEITVGNQCGLEGKKIAKLDLPKDLLIAAIRRKNVHITPHGDTTLEAGDILFVTSESIDSLQAFRDELLDMSCHVTHR